jgi:IS605 OrfB family transposase
MKVVRTIVCKLDPTPEQALEMEDTLKAFASACNCIADVVATEGSANKRNIQKVCYYEVRRRTGLSSNLAIRAIARVCAAMKVAKTKPIFNPTSADYDARIFSFHEKDWTFSLTLLNSRQRIIAVPGEWQCAALAGHKPTFATLVQRRDGRFFLHVQIKEGVSDPLPTDEVLGVDLGQRRIAVDSDGNVYSTKEINQLREHHQKVRRSVQRKGTHAAHKLLKRLSGRERRHASHINHVISRQIVNRAIVTRRAIALEDLKGIRQRARRHNRRERQRLHRWSFYQLRQYIEYKAERAGVLFLFVNPAYTSQTCHRCGQLGKRHDLVFSCEVCGECDADVNAARNIGARVMEPELRGSLAASRGAATH